MDILKNYLDVEELENLINTYAQDILNKLDNDNVNKIILYLLDNKIYYWIDIATSYLDLFLLDSDDFVNRFEKIKYKYQNYIEEIGNNIEILEEMY